MMGFLVHDDQLFSTGVAAEICRALRSYSYHSIEHLGQLRIHFFHNSAPNHNYFIRDKRYTICISGTLIFNNNVHGERAVIDLCDELRRGSKLSGLFKQLRGPYTLVQIDRVAEEVSILNSREGLHCCFLTHRDELRAYSTNLLLLAALADATPSPEGVRQFIHVGAIFEGKTIFQNIERLPGGSLHTYRNDIWTSSRLWQLRPLIPDHRITREKATKTLTSLFLRNFDFTVNLRPDRVAADLTGGSDSRTVLCCLMRKNVRPVAVTSGQKDSVDVHIASRIAAKLGLCHYIYVPNIEHITDDRISLATDLADGSRDVIGLAKLLPYYEEKARRFDFITGGAGGPLFKDHYWQFEFNRVGLGREPNWHRIATLSLVAHAVHDEFFSGFRDRIMDSLAALFLRHSMTVEGTNNQKLDFVYFDLKIPAVAAQDFSLTTQFMDLFHPMLDGDNVQYSINLPPEIRIRNSLEFGMIQDLQPKLRWIPTDAGLPTIPAVGANSWLRVLWARRYLTAASRKVRLALLGSSRGRVGRLDEIIQLRALGYLDLLEHSSLAVSPFVGAQRLQEVRDQPEKQANQYYLLGTLSVQFFFQRIKELRDQGKKLAGQHSDNTQPSNFGHKITL